ncbi:calcium, potassium:sodium antiporter [Aureococcus anophagefferens]|nr:calcium, potassium:sodium antiporter [Aureococcus anophagefferens]
MLGSEARRRLGGDDDDDGCCSGSDKVRADPRWLVIFYIGGITYMFLALAIVCDEYFVPALEEMAEDMHMSLDMAGATLMAAGGSAPELFTSFVATFKRSDLGFGTIVGSAVFNILFVIGVCASAAPAPLSLILFLMYFGYLAVMAQNKNLHYAFMKRVMGKSDAECRAEIAEADDEAVNARSKALAGRFRAGVFTILTERKTVFEMAGIAAVTRIVGDANETFDGIDADASGKIDRDELEAFLRKEGCCDEQLSPEAMAKAVEDMDGNGNGEITREAFVKWYSTCEAQVLAETRRCWDMFDLNGDGRLDASEVVHVLKQMSGDDDVDEDGALKAIAEIKDGARASGVETAGIELTDKGSSLPASTDTVGFDEFKAWFATSEFFQAKSSQTKAVVEAAGDEEDGEGLSLSWPADASPSGKFFFVASFPLVALFKGSMTCLGPYARFVVSILWIGIFSYFMVEWATVVGDTLGIPSVVMGLTFLAAGTSVPDLLSSVIVARQGHGDMAVSSSVGSNIFDVLFGLPVPWLCYAIYHDEPVLVCAGNLAISIMVLIGMICLVVGMINYNKWRMTKSMGNAMFVSYGFFVAQDLIRVFLPNVFGGDC